jgi:hypothetical protein
VKAGAGREGERGRDVALLFFSGEKTFPSSLVSSFFSQGCKNNLIFLKAE